MYCATAGELGGCGVGVIGAGILSASAHGGGSDSHMIGWSHSQTGVLKAVGHMSPAVLNEISREGQQWWHQQHQQHMQVVGNADMAGNNVFAVLRALPSAQLLREARAMPCSDVPCR